MKVKLIVVAVAAIATVSLNGCATMIESQVSQMRGHADMKTLPDGTQQTTGKVMGIRLIPKAKDYGYLNSYGGAAANYFGGVVGGGLITSVMSAAEIHEAANGPQIQLLTLDVQGRSIQFPVDESGYPKGQTLPVFTVGEAVLFEHKPGAKSAVVYPAPAN